MSETTAAAPADGKTFLGHPRGLVILFFAEMWERFSYYGMRALLVLYLTQHFLFSDQRSAVMYGSYTALVYIMTIVGGTLADRYLGSRKAVTFGAILLVLGHFGMAFEGSGSREVISYQGSDYELTLDGRGGDAPAIIKVGGVSTEVEYTKQGIVVADHASVGLPPLVPTGAYETRIEREETYVVILYLSLALIITGVGYLKANISTIVGALYEFGDKRRDAGFTIFYMGINLGSFLSSALCGYLGIVYGWKYGFGLAGIGMALGLAVFLWGQDWLEGRADPPDPEKLKEKVLGFLTVETACYATGLLMIGSSMFLVYNAEFLGSEAGRYIVLGIGVAMLGFLIAYAFMKTEGDERSRMLVAIYIVLAQIPFWALFEQAGSSLNLFTDRLVDRTIFGATVPAPVFQSLNAGFIIIFAPILAWLWVTLSKRGLNPPTPMKFAFGVAGVGLGFLALVAGMSFSGPAGLTAVGFIFLIYWIHTMAELMLSPVGLSAVTKLAPARVVGMTMGSWFLFTGLSNFLAGIIAQSTGAETLGGKITDIAAAKATYASVYTNVAWVAIGLSVLMLIASPYLTKMMKGAD